jgi:hypothetical protein
MLSPEEEDDALADSLVDEVLQEFDLPADLLQDVRDELGDWLVCHPDGRRLLRQLKDDPVVSGSGDVARPEALEKEAVRAVANLLRGKK